MSLTTIQRAYSTAADALGIELDYPKEIVDAVKFGEAAAALNDHKPLNAATELMNAKNIRQWPSILENVVKQNAIAEQAKAAIHGGIVSKSCERIDTELTKWLPAYLTQTRETVAEILANLSNAADEAPTLDPAQAIAGGYGDALTSIFSAASKLKPHTDVARETTGADRVTQAIRSLSMICQPPALTPLRRTEATRIHSGQVRSTPDEVAQRDTARRLLSDWLADETATIHKLARGVYEGHTLSAATGDDYSIRMTRYMAANRTETVPD